MSLIREARKQAERYRLLGSRCVCGALYNTVVGFCWRCGRKGKLSQVRLPRRGEVISSVCVHDALEELSHLVPYYSLLVKLENTNKPFYGMSHGYGEIKEGDQVVSRFARIKEEGSTGYIHYGRTFRPVRPYDVEVSQLVVKRHIDGDVVGILGIGAYVPHLRIKSEEIAKVWGESPRFKLEKTVPLLIDDSAVMAGVAAENALLHAGIDGEMVEACYSGSESKPYDVKPTSTIVLDLVGAKKTANATDFEFACKPGTQAMRTVAAEAWANILKVGLAIGTDIAQSKPGDQLEYTSGAGSVAVVMGRGGEEELVAKLLTYQESNTGRPRPAIASSVKNIGDFFRRARAPYPEHAGRYTGEPAYFDLIETATEDLLGKLGMVPEDFDHVVFHQPNPKFPLVAAKKLGFKREQVEKGLVVQHIGNTYSASTMMGLKNVLDSAEPGMRVLITSFGSGAGSDSMAFEVCEGVELKRERNISLAGMIEDKEYIDYGRYLLNKGMVVQT